jgi:hypothetical protein
MAEERYERLLAIIRRRLAECDQAKDKYDELELSSHASKSTLDRKRYAIDSIQMTLKVILEEIGEPIEVESEVGNG